MQTKFITGCLGCALSLIACNNKDSQKTRTTTLDETKLTLINDVAKDLFKPLDAAIQSFTVSAAIATKVVTTSGFELDLDPHKLALTSTEPITITIKECLTTDALLAADAPTVSNGQLLESAGSYLIEATQQGKKLAIKNGEQLAIRAPKKHQQNMELFYGNRSDNGALNWELATSKVSNTSVLKQQPQKVPVQVSIEVQVGDSAILRPCSLAECLVLYKDSVMKARWAYTIANRHRMTYSQEIKYGLQPINFPFERFKMHVVKGNDTSINRYTMRFSSFQIDGGSSNSYSNMYKKPDTVPLFKDSFYTKWVAGMAEVLVAYEQSYINQFGWVNIDKFYKEPLCDETTIAVNNPLDDMKIYYKFLDLKSVITEFNTTGNSNKIIAGTKLPLDQKVEVYIIGVKGNTVYTSKQIFKVGRRNKLDMTLKPLSQNKLV